MALVVDSSCGMRAAQRQLVPFGCTGPSSGSEVCFSVGEQGCATDQGEQDILDINGDEYLDEDQS